MNNKEINYPEFVKYVHQQFESNISLEDIKQLLYLEEDYNKDNPNSKGKHLLLNRIIFSGKKVSGKEFTHDQALHKGINIWIADNHKGKSTIFKLIKFALTGKDSIKEDVKPWIKEVILEFSIDKSTYTCHIDRTGRDKGALYTFGIEQFIEFQKNQKLDTIEKEKEFEFKSNTQFQEKIQEFFFENFSFYTLKYTTHKSAKDDFGLSIANLSWLTYFKSIYLESKNYEYLFFDSEDMGAQGKKIFEMILGLPLTYPINMLSIQRDRVSEEIGRIRLIDKSRTETTKAKREKIETKFAEITKNLLELKNNSKHTFNENELIGEYAKIQKRANETRQQLRLAHEAHQLENKKLELLELEMINLSGDKQKIESEITRLKKQTLNAEIYQQAESFFSNLDIKACPHCETEVSEDKRVTERTNHLCSLCGEKADKPKVEQNEIEGKIARIKEEINDHSTKLQQINVVIATQKEALKNLRKTVNHQYSKIIAIPSDDADNNRLKQIEQSINAMQKERSKQKKLLEKRDEMIKEEAVLKFQLDEIAKEKANPYIGEFDKLTLKKEILEYALSALEKKRNNLNQDILNKLEQLILKEVHAFGLDSIDQIKINHKYDLVFTQNEVRVSFSDLNEGEKLRVKLAFYLSLIQLDIEHNLGRHPRFLIFDSPGSEEMVAKHLAGLAEILKNVNDRFKDRLQIFIGSALREFIHITDPEKTFIKEEEEFIF